MPGDPLWAVMVVHGVGDTAPGATLEALVPPLVAQSAGRLEEDPRQEVRLLPEPTARPDGPTTRVALAQRFPMHLRWLRAPAGSPKRAVFAEVYWADLSNAGEGLKDLLLRLFTGIFHLRYITDQAADCPGPASMRWMRLLLYGMSWLVCGPLAALNAFLLYLVLVHAAAGLVARWADRPVLEGVRGLVAGALGLVVLTVGVALWRLGQRRAGPADPRPAPWTWGLWALPLGGAVLLGAATLALALAHALHGPAGTGEAEAAVGLLGLTAAVGGALLWRLEYRRQDGGAWTITWGWFTALGLAACALVIVQGMLAPEQFLGGWFGGYVLRRVLPGTTGQPPTALATDALVPYLAVLLWAIQVVFLLAAVLTGLALICWLRARAVVSRPAAQTTLMTHSVPLARARPALDAAIGAGMLQVGLWSVLVPTLHLALLSWTGRDLLQVQLFNAMLAGFALDLSLALLIGLLAGWVMASRWWWVRRHPAPYETPEKREAARTIPRLLVHALVIYGLLVVSVGSGLASVYAYSWPGDLGWRSGLGQWWSSVPLLPVLVVVLALFPRALRDVLHIVMDVISHFFRTRLPVPWPWRPPTPVNPQVFHTQQRIEARFRRVLDEVLALGPVSHLTVVSHSQGTVIALDVLWLADTAKELAGKQVALVTMGSPFSHLYQHYFPYRYPPLFTHGDVFNKGAWGELRQTVSRWINVYRVDDFVGTHIEGDQAGEGSFPVNRCVAAGGHTNYWREPDVLRLLQPYLPGAGAS